MRQERPYRQMELNPKTADGEMHSPEQVQEEMEKARQQVEYLESQKAQWEQQRRQLMQNNEQKALFTEGLNEIGLKIHNAVRRLEKEMESMDREQQEMEQAHECLKRHLQILSALQPANWSNEGLQERMKEALPKLERAENDFNEVFTGGHKYVHTDIFRHKPGVEEKPGFNWAAARDELLRGLAFHLPLFLLLLATWIIYQIVKSS
ncbi:MAG: hypothetical protein MJ058_09185 [Akkermansia sp.]|nr:hypothetical protein [Akkermansia sp.]